MERRAVLKFLTVGAISACPVCAGLVRAAHASDGHGGTPHWEYEGALGADAWGKLSPDFRSCSLGQQQSPVDLGGAVSAELGGIELAYQAVPLKIVNNGHTIQVNTDPGCAMKARGESYKLVQFHFHHPSEHLLSGKRFEMEAHFVHKAEDGRLAVLGVFIRPGAENAAYAPVFANMPEHEGPEKLIEGVKVNPADMLPAGRGYFRYMGSLTTPPCSEGILWSVFKDSLEASPAQIEKFAKLFPMNARPPQELNRRFLLDTRT